MNICTSTRSIGLRPFEFHTHVAQNVTSKQRWTKNIIPFSSHLITVKLSFTLTYDVDVDFGLQMKILATYKILKCYYDGCA